MTLWQRLAFTTGAALIMWAISERIFWSVVHPGDSVVGIASSILPYWFATFFTVWGIEYFRVRTLPGIVLMGAFFGWFIEALVAMTLFGGAGIPLPFSISWTGLAWHMVISVVFVWYLHRVAMATSFTRSLAYSAVLGVFWAFWSMTWFLENPPVVNDLGLYMVHAFAVAALMVIGHLLLSRKMSTFKPSWGEIGFVLLVTVAYTVAITIPALMFMSVGLVVLAAILYVPLRKLKMSSEPGSVLAELSQPVPIRNILTLFAAPVIATLAYGLYLGNAGVVFPFNVATLFVTTPLGFIVLGWAVWRVYRPKAVPLPVPPVPRQ